MAAANKSIRIGIVGSRHYSNSSQFNSYVDNFLQQTGCINYEITIVSGGASGADTLARNYAAMKHYKFIEFPANWKEYGRAAGPIRNSKIVDNIDILLAFRAPTSTGTQDSIDKAKSKGLIVHIIAID